MNRAKMVGQLVLHEGLRQFPYKDTVGKITIGVGRNLTDKGLSHPEIHFLLENDIDGTWDGLAAALPWVKDLDDVRQRVLLDMAFNLGVAGLLKFKATLAAVERGDYAAAATNMLKSKWAKQVGHRAVRLARMMSDGVD